MSSQLERWLPQIRVGSSQFGVSLLSKSGHLTLSAEARRRPSISTVVGGLDRLRLVFVTGVQIYQRLDALPRIRWAGRSEVIAEQSERLFVLSAHIDPDVVVRNQPGPAGSGRGASLRILQDGGDQLRTSVSAAGDGYLVVADSMQQGWKAYLDGRFVRCFRQGTPGGGVRPGKRAPRDAPLRPEVVEQGSSHHLASLVSSGRFSFRGPEPAAGGTEKVRHLNRH
jgi:hypothetical protein